MRTPNSPEALEIDAWLERRRLLDAYGRRVLGATGWRLFEQYGRLMAGPKSGLYVSALSAYEVAALVDALACGRVLLIHLMHRHVSGNYESSRLLLVKGKLVMRFADRDEAALRSDRHAPARHIHNCDEGLPPVGSEQAEASMSLFRPSKSSFERKFERVLARFQHPFRKVLAALVVCTSPRRQGFGHFGEHAAQLQLLEESGNDLADGIPPS